jgi:hypothetical protein
MRLHEYAFQTGEHRLWKCDTLVTDTTCGGMGLQYTEFMRILLTVAPYQVH